MNSKPHISIIIPVYNVEPYIHECLQSVANQTITDELECIIVDDCGTDNSMEIVNRCVNNYNGKIRFRILNHDKNYGLSYARNTGIKAAEGRYVFFLDSDDYITPKCIETLYLVAIKYDTDLVQGKYITASQHLNKAMSIYHPAYTADRKYIKRTFLDYDRNPVMAQNRLIRRQLIIDNSLWFKEGIIHEDNYWTFFLAKHVKRMAFCPDKLYFYRETPGSITKSKNIDKEALAFKTMVSDFSANIDPFERGAQKRYIFLHLLMLLNNGYCQNRSEEERFCKLFLSQCRLHEKFVVKLALNTVGIFRHRFINLAQRVFML